jgi:hypothetical protein
VAEAGALAWLGALQAQFSPQAQVGPQAQGWQLQLSLEQGLVMGMSFIGLSMTGT